MTLELIQLLNGSKAFRSTNSKTIVGIQESIFPYSLNKNLTFKHCVNAEIDLEVIESKNLKDFGV